MRAALPLLVRLPMVWKSTPYSAAPLMVPRLVIVDPLIGATTPLSGPVIDAAAPLLPARSLALPRSRPSLVPLMLPRLMMTGASISGWPGRLNKLVSGVDNDLPGPRGAGGTHLDAAAVLGGKYADTDDGQVAGRGQTAAHREGG